MYNLEIWIKVQTCLQNTSGRRVHWARSERWRSISNIRRQSSPISHGIKRLIQQSVESNSRSDHLSKEHHETIPEMAKRTKSHRVQWRHDKVIIINIFLYHSKKFSNIIQLISSSINATSTGFSVSLLLLFLDKSFKDFCLKNQNIWINRENRSLTKSSTWIPSTWIRLDRQMSWKRILIELEIKWINRWENRTTNSKHRPTRSSRTIQRRR